MKVAVMGVPNTQQLKLELDRLRASGHTRLDVAVENDEYDPNKFAFTVSIDED